MLKSLLIHNDNTPLNIHPDISTSILFAPTLEELNNSDIDTYISKRILSQIKNEEFDIVFIRDTLSENYIDFYGLVLAYHIRLSTATLKKEQNLTPIVILSDIDSYIINKITSIGQILFTKNIFIAPNNKSTLDRFNNENFKPILLTSDEYNFDFLDKINIKPPKDYLSHHSITNEWAIHHWSQLLGVKDKESIKKNETKISSMLYFKYLEKKYHLHQMTEIPDDRKNKEGKILLIDDKCADGWSDILQKFCSKFYTEVTLESLGHEYKDIKDIEYIKKQVKEKINSYNPDIILLDLRLMEELDSAVNITSNEDDKQRIKEISGVKILEYIRERKNTINQGIQIIIFSASTDSLILDYVYKQAILGYIKKDSPTNKYLATKNSLGKLKQLISGKDAGLDKRYLKNIWNIQELILNTSFLTNSSESEIFTIRDNVKSIFEILNSNIKNPYKYAMLAIFKCIELLNEYFIDDIYNFPLWKASKSNIESHRKKVNSTENYLLNVIDKKTNLSMIDYEDMVKNIVCSRNLAIHTKILDHCIGFTVENPKHENLEKWFSLLSEIFNGIKIEK